MRPFRYPWVLTSALMAANAAAQDVTASDVSARSSDAPATTMRKISVTATRRAEALRDIPSTVSVITDDEMTRELARDIKDLVRYEPGVSVANAGSRFGLAGFNIRGIDGNRIGMRVDGIRMNDAFQIGSFSDARRNLVELDALKAVEIVRGPASALYGSDAIGGVVSFVTKDPQDVLPPGKSLALSARSDYRTDSKTWGAGSTLALGGEQLSALLVYRHRDGNETENRGSRKTRDSTRTASNPQDREADSALAKLTWQLTSSQVVRLTTAYDRDETFTNVLSSLGRGTGSLANIMTVGLDGEDQQERKRASLDHSIDLSTAAIDRLESRIYVQDTTVEQRSLEQRYAVSAGPASAVVRDRRFNFEQRTTGGEIVARKRFVAGRMDHQLTYGVEWVTTDTKQLRNGRQITLATGAATSNIQPDNFPVRDFPKTTTDQYAFYVQDQMTFAEGSLQITPGARVDRYELHPQADPIFLADNPGVGLSHLNKTSVSPKLGGIWHFAEPLSLYASYARGFRAPPYSDVNIGFTNLAFGYTAIANADLKPETSNGYEIGLRGEGEGGFFGLAGFYNEYDDFIASLMPVGTRNGLQVFQSRNLSKAHIYGAELRGGWSLLDDVIRVRGSVAHARGAGSSAGQTGDRPLNSVDPLKAVLGMMYRPTRAWSVELIGTAVRRHRDVDQSTAQFVPAGYFIVDLLGQASLGGQTRLNVGVFNLFDRKYWDGSDVRGVAPTSVVLDRYTRPGVNVGASVTVDF